MQSPAKSPLRKIIHVDMDAFYASVEQRDDPALRGKPVVVAWRGPRSVVCAASYEARAFGVHSAMPAVTAERRCPQAIFVPPDFSRYRAVSQKVQAIFARYTALIEPLSLDEAYLDVTHSECGLPTATSIAKQIRTEIFAETELTASAGVAPNKFIAKIASDWRKPNGLFVVQPHEVLDFLAPLPVGKIPGVGKVMEARLHRYGLKTIQHLRELEPRWLEQRFGRWGARLHELSLGIDEHPVAAHRPAQSISVEDTFETDYYREQLDPVLKQLATRVWALRRKTPRQPRTIVLKLKTSDFRSLTRSLTPEQFPDSAEALHAIALGLLARVDLPAETRYRLAGVGFSNFDDAQTETVQAELPF